MLIQAPIARLDTTDANPLFRWLEGYRSLLDRWMMWEERALLDIEFRHVFEYRPIHNLFRRSSSLSRESQLDALSNISRFGPHSLGFDIVFFHPILSFHAGPILSSGCGGDD